VLKTVIYFVLILGDLDVVEKRVIGATLSSEVCMYICMYIYIYKHDVCN
jgi:hypothetical protein